MLLPHLFVAPSGDRGRGVFTSKAIAANTVIEMSPVLVFSQKERKFIEETLLYNYVFEWGDTKRQRALGLGYISLYNHSYDANCEYEMDYDNGIMTITTVKAIKKGEELFINYNAAASDKTPVWFDVQ